MVPWMASKDKIFIHIHIKPKPSGAKHLTGSSGMTQYHVNMLLVLSVLAMNKKSPVVKKERKIFAFLSMPHITTLHTYVLERCLMLPQSEKLLIPIIA